MGYDHTLMTETTLKPGTTSEQAAQAFKPIFDYFGYESLECELLSDHEIEFNPDTGNLHVYTNGEVSYGFDGLVKEVAKNLEPLTTKAGYFELSNYDTADIDNAREKIYFGPSKKAIEAFKTQEDVDEAMSLLSSHIDGAAVAKIRETVAQATGRMAAETDLPPEGVVVMTNRGTACQSHGIWFGWHPNVVGGITGKMRNQSGVTSWEELKPNRIYERILSVMMQDIVGDYDTPDQVPEWSWVERVASYTHAKNGQDGIWEFVLNLSYGWDDIPDRLLPVISEAKAGNLAYLIFHQGT